MKQQLKHEIHTKLLRKRVYMCGTCMRVHICINKYTVNHAYIITYRYIHIIFSLVYLSIISTYMGPTHVHTGTVQVPPVYMYVCDECIYIIVPRSSFSIVRAAQRQSITHVTSHLLESS